MERDSDFERAPSREEDGNKFLPPIRPDSRSKQTPTHQTNKRNTHSIGYEQRSNIQGPGTSSQPTSMVLEYQREKRMRDMEVQVYELKRHFERELKQVMEEIPNRLQRELSTIQSRDTYIWKEVQSKLISQQDGLVVLRETSKGSMKEVSEKLAAIQKRVTEHDFQFGSMDRTLEGITKNMQMRKMQAEGSGNNSVEVGMELIQVKELIGDERARRELNFGELKKTVGDLREKVHTQQTDFIKAINRVKEEGGLGNGLRPQGDLGGTIPATSKLDALHVREVEYLKDVIRTCEKRIDDETANRIKLEEDILRYLDEKVSGMKEKLKQDEKTSLEREKKMLGNLQEGLMTVSEIVKGTDEQASLNLTKAETMLKTSVDRLAKALEATQQAVAAELATLREEGTDNRTKLSELELSSFQHRKMINENFTKEVNRFEKIVSALENHINEETGEFKIQLDHVSEVSRENYTDLEGKLQLAKENLAKNTKALNREIKKVDEKGRELNVIMRGEIESNRKAVDAKISQTVSNIMSGQAQFESEMRTSVDEFRIKIDTGVNRQKKRVDDRIKKMEDSIENNKKSLDEHIKQQARSARAVAKALVDRETAERHQSEEHMLLLLSKRMDELERDADRKLINLEVLLNKRTDRLIHNKGVSLEALFQPQITMAEILAKIDSVDRLQQEDRLLVKIETQSAKLEETKLDFEGRLVTLHTKSIQNQESIQGVQKNLDTTEEKLEDEIKDEKEHVDLELCVRDIMSDMIGRLAADERKIEKAKINDRFKALVGIDLKHEEDLKDEGELRKKLDQQLKDKIQDTKTEIEQAVDVKITVMDKHVTEEGEKTDAEIKLLAGKMEQTNEKVNQMAENIDKKLEEESERINTKLSEEMKNIDEKIESKIGEMDEKMEGERKIMNGKLTQEVEARSMSGEDTNSKLAEELEKLNIKLMEELKTLQDKLAQEVEGLTMSDEDGKAQVTQEIIKLNTKLTEEITKLEEKNTTSFKDMKTEIDEKLAKQGEGIILVETNLGNEINKNQELEAKNNEKTLEISNKMEEMSTKQGELKTEIDKDVEGKLAEVSTKQDEMRTELSKDIDEKLAGFNTKQDDMVKEIEVKMTEIDAIQQESKTKQEELKTEINKDIDDKLVGINTKQDEMGKEIEGKMTEMDAKHEGLKTEINKDIDDKLININTKQDEIIKEIEGKMTEIDTKQQGLKTEINKDIDDKLVGISTKQDEMIKEIEGKMTEIDAKQDESKTVILKEIDEKLSAMESKNQELTMKNEENQQKIDSQISEVDNKMQKNTTEITQRLETGEMALTSTLTEYQSKNDTRVENIEKNMAESGKSTEAEQKVNNLETKIEGFDQRLFKKGEELEDKVDEMLNQANISTTAKFKTKFDEMKASLDKCESSIQELKENQGKKDEAG